MRINKFIAQCTELSRRAADSAIAAGRVTVNGVRAQAGQIIHESDRIELDDQQLIAPAPAQIILFNKPVGYVVSRDGQGARTIYELLPPEVRHLNAVGRLDKESSGLLVLTNDGQLAQQLTHPSFQKTKVYEVAVDNPLRATDKQTIEKGVMLDEGLSRLRLAPLNTTGLAWRVTMSEGRKRQIRRTFAAVGYTVVRLHRTQFGAYVLPGDLSPGSYMSTSDR